MKKKGFTLIELIVVIAIIGVLAAILVPAMLGYVKKSKITASNSAAKSLYDAAQSAITDIDSMDDSAMSIAALKESEGQLTVDGDITLDTNWATKAASGDVVKTFQSKVYGYFSDIDKLAGVAIGIDADGQCDGVAVYKGTYPGSHPKAMDPDIYDDSKDAFGKQASKVLAWVRGTSAATTPPAA